MSSGTSVVVQSVPCLLLHLPVGKLVPLPIPRQPWSHLGIDFVTDLPVSEENTCILVAVDRFSKACKLIPLRGLPTALETAEHLFQQVFRRKLYRIAVHSSSPTVWKAFFRLLGVTVSLSSGYHPQTNGRENARSRNSDVTFGHTAKKTSSVGAVSSHGPNMHKTPFVRTPPASLPSNAYSSTNHHSSHGRESLRRFQLLTTGSGRARECGTQSTSTASGSAETQDLCRRSRPNSPLSTWRPGVVVHPQPATPPAL